MKKLLYALLLLFITSYLSCGFKSEKVDLIVHNATIYTVDNDFNTHQAMAINNGKIVAIGAERAILNKYTSKKTLDAATKYVFPGFIDAHCHFYGYGLNQNEINLVGTKSWDECIEKIERYAEKNKGEWIIGRGWDQNDWDEKVYPNNEKLNKLFPNTPVFINRIDGHAAIVNSKTLELAGIDVNTMVKGGEILKNKDGQLTGILIDNGMNPVYEIEPSPNPSEIKNALLRAQLDCFEEGLTTIDDAGLSMNVVSIIEELQKSNELKMRIYAMLSPSESSLDQMKKGPIKTDRLNVRSVKLYGDGALGSRGACMKQDYHDQLNHKGALIEDILFYQDWANNCAQHGFQLNTHCIGDSSNLTLLKTYAQHLKDNKDLRWRIEHAQIVSPADRHFFKDYSIIPSVQPTHATSDMYWAEERIGSERMAGAYAYKSLLNLNGMIALGTDFPVEQISPIKTFYAAIARKDDKNYPKDGFQMDEALTREEALRGMTFWAAMSNFEEDEKGSLEIGKFADFVVLDRDLMTVGESYLLETKVEYTFVNGEQVYRR